MESYRSSSEKLYPTKFNTTINANNVESILTEIQNLAPMMDKTFPQITILNEKACLENGRFGHLLSIKARCTSSLARSSYPSNFILRHDKYVDPLEFVLNNDRVTLMGHC